VARNITQPLPGTPIGAPGDLARIVGQIAEQTDTAIPSPSSLAGNTMGDFPSSGPRLIAPIPITLRIFEIVADIHEDITDPENPITTTTIWHNAKPTIATPGPTFGQPDQSFPGPTLGWNWWAYAREIVYWWHRTAEASPQESFWKANKYQSGFWSDQNRKTGDDVAGFHGSLTPVWVSTGPPNLSVPPNDDPPAAGDTGVAPSIAVGDWVWCVFDYPANVWRVIKTAPTSTVRYGLLQTDLAPGIGETCQIQEYTEGDCPEYGYSSTPDWCNPGGTFTAYDPMGEFEGTAGMTGCEFIEDPKCPGYAIIKRITCPWFECSFCGGYYY
jgi:hypothetical protein